MDNKHALYDEEMLLRFEDEAIQERREEMLEYFEDNALYEKGYVPETSIHSDSAYLWDNDESEVSYL